MCRERERERERKRGKQSKTKQGNHMVSYTCTNTNKYYGVLPQIIIDMNKYIQGEGLIILRSLYYYYSI